jgi:sigma-B regulation protein RsbU (phosphoserine phosphatase)
MFPAVETAGDYFDFMAMPAAGEDVSGIAVGDVSGHGLGPAMMMAETRGCLHSFALLESDLARMLTYTNRVLVKNRNEHYVTLFLAYIDESTRCLNYASAGHTAWHFSATGQATELESTGLPLGMSDDADFNWTMQTSAPLLAGDFVLIMTDGITESRGSNGDLFGNDRMFDFVHQHHDESAQQIVTQLHEHVRQYTSDAPQADDITMVIVKVAL